jgi:hypothetical protein
MQHQTRALLVWLAARAGIGAAAAFVAWAGFITISSAKPVGWTTYAIAESGTTVDIPSSIFTERTGHPDGYGQRFETSDGRADLTVQSVPNTHKESPAAFLAKKHPPPNMQYKRVTPRFFAVSSYKGDKVWYDRCNFSARFVHCVLINYPASEEHSWDDVVTRISLSLRGD